ncbi:hypothetical protein CCAX7_25460 [Capsulimonas corticalis]|uniref:Uncharacterized protein n=1 Tax=Capsulimonas corticalis TaxID=2219043 RepID=A0A402CVR1_9BACT|nr:LacI family DNA-binding transcriptional regulator [Capsulimonas corticalis]BDI30495.1 hypothetical protein CCAX7_25460 [Capsulimonas corticalis]
MSTTQKDIAAKLKLSQSLVGKILNGSPNVWASEETRQRILVTARDMGYQPHAAARALRSGKTRIIGYLTLQPPGIDPRTEDGGEVKALASSMAEIGYGLLVNVLPSQHQLLTSLRQMAASRSCDAFVLWGAEADILEQGDLLEKLEAPFFVKGHYPAHPTWRQIDYDHHHMMAQVVAHFVSLGHRRIAYVGFEGKEEHLRRLLDGYMESMQANGLPTREALIVAEVSDIDLIAAHMERWLDLPEDEQPTAIAVGAGNAAWEGIETALARRGRFIGDRPGDIAVAGETHWPFRLMFGRAMGYTQVELADLIRAMASELIFPVLRGESVEPVVRIRPTLQPLDTLDLRNYSVVMVEGAPERR